MIVFDFNVVVLFIGIDVFEIYSMYIGDVFVEVLIFVDNIVGVILKK